METEGLAVDELATLVYSNRVVEKFLLNTNLNKYFPPCSKSDVNVNSDVHLIINDNGELFGLEIMFKLYGRITYKTIHFKVSEILWETFKHRYLLPVLELTYSKMKNYRINFYKENPLEDGFNIAFTRFMLEEGSFLFDLEKSVQKKLMKYGKKITVSILDTSSKYHDYKLIELLNEICYDPYLSITLTRVVKNIFMDKYFGDMEAHNQNNIIRKVYLELSAFHVNNAISLSKYASRISHDIDHQYHDFLIKLKDLKEFNSFNDNILKFIENIRGTVDFIREISRVSEYKNIDTYIDLTELYEPISLIELKMNDLALVYNSYKDKYLTNGLKDEDLISTIMAFINTIINDKITKHITSKRENNFVISYDCMMNQVFTVSEDDIKERLFNIKGEERYKEVYPVLYKDTFEFVDRFTHKIELIVQIYIRFINRISEFIRDKLYINSVSELDFDIESDLHDRINSMDSITDVKMIQELIKY